MLDKCKMTDSGIEWIRDIPQNWSVFPAGGVFSEVKEKNTNNEYSNAFSFRYGEIVDKKTNGVDDESVDETLSAYRVVSPNTIMINGLNLNYDFITQRVAIVKEKGIITSAYLAVQPDEGRIVPKFALYLFKAYDAKQVFHGMGSGVRKTLKYSDFKHIRIVAPSMDEQQRIVTYLDCKTQEIDGLIAEAKASIEEYKAWKVAEINESVNGNQFPRQKAKLRNFCSFYNGDRSNNYPSPDEFSNEGIPFIGADALNGMYVDTQAARFISQEKYNSMGGLKIQKYDILYTLRGSTIGKNAMSMFDDGTVASSLMGIRVINPELCLPEFLLYWLNSYEEYWQRDTCINGSTAPNLSAEDVKGFVIYLPSIDIQKRTIDKLNKRISAIDSIILEKAALVTDLESYKESLIFEVVTGKRRVC